MLCNLVCVCVVSDLSPLIIDEEHGIVYSPSSRRAETMALRLQQMKERRENLSPTGMAVSVNASD